MKTYVVLSRLPPPFGGVSIFAERKIKKLLTQGHRVVVVNLGSPDWIFRLLYCAVFERQADYLVNTLQPVFLLALWFLGLTPRVSLYDHNHSRRFRYGTIRYRLFLFLARRVKEVVIVHKHLNHFYANTGVRTRVESPFIPPDLSQEQTVLATYPRCIHQFLAQESGPCLLNSAWRYVRLGMEDDLYGFHTSLLLLKRLRKNGIPVRLLFVFGQLDNTEVPDSTKQLVEELEKEGALRVLIGRYEIWPMFKRVKGFLRTTATDGESVSVLEALHFGCPVVASDVVPRPVGVVTYRYGDLDNLYEAVVRILRK